MRHARHAHPLGQARYNDLGAHALGARHRRVHDLEPRLVREGLGLLVGHHKAGLASGAPVRDELERLGIAERGYTQYGGRRLVRKNARTSEMPFSTRRGSGSDPPTRNVTRAAVTSTPEPAARTARESPQLLPHRPQSIASAESTSPFRSLGKPCRASPIAWVPIPRVQSSTAKSAGRATRMITDRGAARRTTTSSHRSHRSTGTGPARPT